jgi:hypothetical protein
VTRAAAVERAAEAIYVPDPLRDVYRGYAVAALAAVLPDVGEGGAEHRCGWDLDPYCDGCRAAMRDAGEPPC